MTDLVDEYNKSLQSRGKRLRWKPAVKTRAELPEQPEDRTACFVADEDTLFVFDSAKSDWNRIPLKES